MWKHVAAQAFGALMPEINSMWSSYENALNSPCAAWIFLGKMDTFPLESVLQDGRETSLFSLKIAFSKGVQWIWERAQ